MWLLNIKLAIDTALSACSAAIAEPRPLPADRLQWTFSPLVVISLLAAVLLYAYGFYRAREIKEGSEPDAWHRLAFAGGMVMLFLALCSPVEALSDYLFSMHMTQHIVLMMLAPPLIVWSNPGPTFALAFPPAARAAIARLWRRAGLHHVVNFFMQPVIAWTMFCGAFIFWHVPLPYQWGMNYQLAHSLEQASFLLTALAFWTLVIEPSGERRLSYGATLIYLLVTVIVTDLPGALMVLSPRLLYPGHGGGVALFGLTPLQDQQLAGLIMWIPAGGIYLAAMIWLFARMLAEPERRSMMRLGGPAAISCAVLLLPLVLGGCNDNSDKANSFGGNPSRGASLIAQIGCGGCHTIPGITGAKGLVGPPLNQLGDRVYIAGVLRNTPENLMAWIENPQKIVPNNAMPNMGIPEQDARDIAAYLYTLN